MKSAGILLFWFLLTLRVLAQEGILTPFEALSKTIKITEDGGSVFVELTTGVPIGPHLLQVSSRGPLAYSSDKRVLLKYLYIWDASDPRSKRMFASGTVTWKLRKDDWDKWNSEKDPTFILKADCVQLSKEEVETIKKEW